MEMEMEMTRAYGVFRGIYVQHRNLQYSTLLYSTYI